MPWAPLWRTHVWSTAQPHKALHLASFSNNLPEFFIGYWGASVVRTYRQLGRETKGGDECNKHLAGGAEDCSGERWEWGRGGGTG